MPKCEKHPIRQLSCNDCFTAAELEAEISFLQSIPIPSPRGQGEKSRPRRTDTLKPRKASWKDEFDV